MPGVPHTSTLSAYGEHQCPNCGSHSGLCVSLTVEALVPVSTGPGGMLEPEVKAAEEWWVEEQDEVVKIVRAKIGQRTAVAYCTECEWRGDVEDLRFVESEFDAIS